MSNVRPLRKGTSIVKLEDAIFVVIQMPEHSAVCAKEPFFRGAEAVVTTLTAEYAVPPEVLEAGYKYFLEGSEVEELLAMLESKAASRGTAAEFVIHYATFDAYPNWYYDLPGK
jgi:hypothetical protein